MNPDQTREAEETSRPGPRQNKKYDTTSGSTVVQANMQKEEDPLDGMPGKKVGSVRSGRYTDSNTPDGTRNNKHRRDSRNSWRREDHIRSCEPPCKTVVGLARNSSREHDGNNSRRDAGKGSTR